MKRKRADTLVLFLFLPSVVGGGWASVGFPAELPSTQVASSLFDRLADRISVIEPTLVSAESMGAPAPIQMRVGNTGEDEQGGHILGSVPRMMSDSTLDPVGSLGPASTLLATQSHMLSSTESANEVSASFRSPQQSITTPDHGYRDAMPGGPPSDHP